MKFEVEEHKRRCVVIVSSSPTTSTKEEEEEQQNINDSLDTHNKPRKRKSLIVETLRRRQRNLDDDDRISLLFRYTPHESSITPTQFVSIHQSIHSTSLLHFLLSAWDRWINDYIHTNRRDDDCCSFPPSSSFPPSEEEIQKNPPGLIPSHCPLHRITSMKQQRPNVKNVMGAVGYYCTDRYTPIVSTLREELMWDCDVVTHAVDVWSNYNESDFLVASYAVTIHPGHHASFDSYGGYCFVNHAAMATRRLQEKMMSDDDEKRRVKVAILDVDYHCGNGTSSIFHNDPSVLFISIHCHPEYEYPFHTGYEDDIGDDEGVGATMHIPLLPGTTWGGGYGRALEDAMERIVDEFDAEALVISLGLDTHEKDEIATPGAGFSLTSTDYSKMGRVIGSKLSSRMPVVFIQEGGYKLDVVGDAASDVVLGFASAVSL